MKNPQPDGAQIDSDSAAVADVPSELLRAALNRSYLDALSPASLGVAVIFAFFTGFNYFDLPPDAATPVIAWDLCLVAFFLGQYGTLRRAQVAPRFGHPLGLLTACLVCSNILLTYWLTKDPWYTMYTSIVAIVIGYMFLSIPWLGVTLAAIFAGWLAVSLLVIDSTRELARFGFVLFAASGASLMICAARIKTYSRLEGMRIRDADRKAELQIALSSRVESEERYRQLVDTLPMGIVVHAEDEILFANKKGLEIVGHDRQEDVIGKSPFDFIDPAYREFARERSRMTHEEGQAALFTEMKFVGKDGVKVDAETAVFPISYHGKKAVQSIFQVITERKQAEEERRTLQEQLSQNRKMEAIGTLAGGVAHDFNNLLTGILGYANLLKTHSHDREQVLKAAGVIENAAERAAGLTKQLLGFSRQGKHQNTPVDLGASAQRVETLLERTIDKKIQIKTVFDTDPSYVMGDPDQLELVILNLAVNSRDSMPDGGELHFKIKNVELTEADHDAHPELDVGPYVELSVSDSGSGIPETVIDRIFEPFFTTKGQGEGTGMGLAMVYGIVQNHGGTVSAENNADRGATIRILLPATSRRPVPVSQDSVAAQPVSGEGLVLIVDDEAIVREIAGEMLGSLGYDVIMAHDGAEAIERFREHDSQIDLVLLDMIMPRLSGRECFLELKTIDPNIKAILSTGYTQEGSAQEILDQGMVGFIQKPYQIGALSKVVAAAIAA